jgi:SAM-dependent methyltransferase
MRPGPDRSSTVSAESRPVAAPHCPACALLFVNLDEPTIRGTDRLHGTPGAFDVVVCSRCGTGLTLPLVGEDHLPAFYPDSYNAYGLPDAAPLRAAATALFRWRYWRGLRRPPLEALTRRPAGRLLDAGGGRGDLGVVLRRRGWQVTSLDPSPSACAEARRRGVDAHIGTLTDPPREVGRAYDAVVFQHSLEHVVRPASDLASVRERLVDGALVLITVPNFGSWQRRRFGADWFHLDLPRHRTHFTADGLSRLLQSSGFTDLELSTSTSADGLPMSLQYRRLGRRIAPGAGRLAATAASLLGTPITAALNALGGEGDFLHAVAVKPYRAASR